MRDQQKIWNDGRQLKDIGSRWKGRDDMLGQCNDLIECERILSDKAKETSLLGDIVHSDSDIDRLASLISRQIGDDPEKGIESLRNKAPASLSCLLVWIGNTEYDEGKYWPFIRRKIGLPDEDRWGKKLGNIFLDYLRKMELPIFKEGHRYVTPILFHGSIPDHCLPKYFEEVLVPIIKHDLHDPADSEEIGSLLQDQRENHKEIKEIEAIEKEKNGLQKQRNQASRQLDQYNSLLNIWDDLERIKGLETKGDKIDELIFLPDDPYEYKTRRNSEIQAIQGEIDALYEKKREYEQKVQEYSEEDKQILIHSDEIAGSVKVLLELEKGTRERLKLKKEEGLFSERLEKEASSIFFKAWDDRYGKTIREIPFDRLKEVIELLIREVPFDRPKERIESLNFLNFEIKERRGVWRIVKEYILAFFGRQKEKRAKEIRAEILEMVKGLPIKKEEAEYPRIELAHNLRQILDRYKSLCDVRKNIISIEDENRNLLMKIRDVVEIMGIRITDDAGDMIKFMQDKLAVAQSHRESADDAEKEIKEIEIHIKGLKDKKGPLAKDIQEIDNRLAGLGGGDVRLGVENLRYRRNVQNEARSIRSNLAQTYPDMDSLEEEKDKAEENGRDKDYYTYETGCLRERIKEFDEKIDGLKERPEQIQEPFHYVDKPIRRFLLNGGDIAEEFFVKSVRMLNQTIEDEMVSPFDEIGLSERVVAGFEEWWEGYKEKIKRGEADEIITRSGERFRSPVIFLAIGEIKVSLPAQHFLIPDDLTDICLTMNEERVRGLRLYRYSNEPLKTEELDFPLPFPSDEYRFTLKAKNKELRSWSIQGITPDHPFMALDASKRLIQNKELPKGDVWIVLNNKLALEPDQIIKEEAPLYGKWREYKHLRLDISNIDQLNLVDEDGKGYPIGVCKEHVSKPMLYGENLLEGVQSGGEKIYIGKPPDIRIPIKSDVEIRRWRIFIYSDGDSTLDKSLRHRLSDLEVKIDADICGLSLEEYLGKEPVGRFKVRLRNNLQNIDEWFFFSVLPSLNVEFDKEIYLPKEKIYLTIEGPCGMEFGSGPGDQVKLIDQRDGLCKIEANSPEKSIYGSLKYPSLQAMISMPMTIQIPRLMWRIEGLDEECSSNSDGIGEMWFGDWEKAEELYLVVSMPSSIEGKAQLILHDSDQQPKAEIKEGMVRFNLPQFKDTLRRKEQPVHGFELSVSDTSLIEDVELFKVRTKWEVSDIKCEEDTESEELNIQWNEKGKAENRVIRLWGLKSRRMVHEEPIARESHEATIPTANIFGGRYLIQITKIDHWSGAEGLFPEEDTPYTKLISILPFFMCRRCDFESYSVYDMKTHIKDCHIDDLVESITYEEHREYDSSLPHSICKCSYCNYYSREDDLRNPINLICQHIEKDCLKAEEEHGLRTILFRLIEDVDEIRKYVGLNLPHIHKCKLCGLKDFEQKDQLGYLSDHILEEHRDELFVEYEQSEVLNNA